MVVILAAPCNRLKVRASVIDPARGKCDLSRMTSSTTQVGFLLLLAVRQGGCTAIRPNEAAWRRPGAMTMTAGPAKLAPNGFQ